MSKFTIRHLPAVLLTGLFLILPPCLIHQANGPPPKPNQEKPVKTVYLTFDDGPSKNTLTLMEILGRYQVKATFFVMAKPEYRTLYAEILKNGHSLGLHTYSHDYNKIYSSGYALLQDIAAIERYVYEQTGVHCTIYRFPGGSRNMIAWHMGLPVFQKTFIQPVLDKGYTYYDWDISADDALGKTLSPEEIVSNVIKQVKNQDRIIILLHDAPAQKTTPAAVEELIARLSAKGYVFDSLKPMTAVPVIPGSAE